MTNHNKPKKEPTGDYAVGYARTPEHTRFKKGQTGNPKGKPAQQSRPFAESVKEVFGEFVEVKLANGNRKKIGAIEAGLMRLRNKAIQGDAKALDQMFKLLEKYPIVAPKDKEHSFRLVLPSPPVNTFEWLMETTGSVDEIMQMIRDDPELLPEFIRLKARLDLDGKHHSGLKPGTIEWDKILKPKKY